VSDTATRPGTDRPRVPRPQGVGDHQQGTRPTAVPAARQPLGTPGVALLGPLLALAVVALGVAGVHDGLGYAGALGGRPWLAQLSDHLGVTSPDRGVVAWGVVAALVGLVLLSFALGRRPRPPHQVSGPVPLFLTDRDVALLASTAARDVDGVLKVGARATRRSVALRVTTTANGPDPTIDDAVAAAVTARLAPLQQPPRVRVTATEHRS